MSLYQIEEQTFDSHKDRTVILLPPWKASGQMLTDGLCFDLLNSLVFHRATNGYLINMFHDVQKGVVYVIHAVHDQITNINGGTWEGSRYSTHSVVIIMSFINY